MIAGNLSWVISPLYKVGRNVWNVADRSIKNAVMDLEDRTERQGDSQIDNHGKRVRNY